MMLSTWLALSLCIWAPAAPSARLLTLDEALQIALAQQPNVRIAAAQTASAQSVAVQSRAALLPQLTGNAMYERTTANFVARPGYVPAASAGSALKAEQTSDQSYNFWNFGLSLSQLIFDFGASWRHYRSDQANVDASSCSEKLSALSAALQVRNAFLTARADKARVQVGLETLTNQQHHLTQVEGYIAVGTHPEIDLAQARTNLANAKVSLINYQTTYETDKLALNQAMGVDGPVDYDVADQDIPTLDVEDAQPDVLLSEAKQQRPDLTASRNQLRAQHYLIDSHSGALWPVLAAQAQVTDQGADLRNLGWNWYAGLNLSWNIFQGGQQIGLVEQDQAKLAVLQAQDDALQQSVRVDVERSRLQIIASKEALRGAEEALLNARAQLKLAEGRYETGVGNMVELSDSQLAYTNAAVQRVQAELNLFSARAALLKALGRM